MARATEESTRTAANPEHTVNRAKGRREVNADTCKDFLKALELYHDRKFSSVARDAYWAGLKDYSDEKIVLVLQASYGKFPPGRVPSVNDLKLLLSEMRETSQAREKASELANKYPLSRRRKPQHPMARESFLILARLLYPDEGSSRLTTRQCVGEMLRMEEKYPGFGWRQSAESLRASVDRKEKLEAGAVDKELEEIESQARAELEKEKGGL